LAERLEIIEPLPYHFENSWQQTLSPHWLITFNAFEVTVMKEKKGPGHILGK